MFVRTATLLASFVGIVVRHETRGETFCPGGIPGIEESGICCSTLCGECGGVGCSMRGSEFTGDDCCTVNIASSGRLCDVTQEAPCIIGSAPTAACPDGTNACNDPHVQGLRGQVFEWHGEEGGWYCLVKDFELGLQINVRPTAPLRDKFPTHQYITGIAVIYGGHSIEIEVKDPYSVNTEGCPLGMPSCVANGGLRIRADGQEAKDLLRPGVAKDIAPGIVLSATNLPLECRDVGGSKVWASMHRSAPRDDHMSSNESFEDWVLKFGHVIAPRSCDRFVREHGLLHVQSKQAIFRIVTPTAEVRFSAGVNYRAGGERDREGRELPPLDFWQTSIGMDGLSLNNEYLTGIVGETAHLMLAPKGGVVMKGLGAIPGEIEDYRVLGPLGGQFAFLDVDLNRKETA